MFSAILYPFRGLAYLVKHRELWKYAAAAFVVNLFLFTLLLYLFAFTLPTLVDWTTPDSWPAWVHRVMGCLLAIAGLFVGLLVFTVIGSMIAGPFLEAMTERMMRDLGEPLSPSRSFWASLGFSVLNQGLKLIVFLTIQAALLLLLIPPLTPLHPVVAGFFTVVFLGMEYLEYALELRGLSVPGRLRWVAGHLGPTIGLGAVSFLFLLVPFLAYFLLPVSVCGATLLAHDIAKREAEGTRKPAAGADAPAS